MKSLPPASYLRECFDYDGLTGEVRWRVRPTGHLAHLRGRGSTTWRRRFPGTIAGAASSHQVVIDGEAYFIHRVIWKWMTGDDPVGEIDHKNRDPGDNRWANLRLADRVAQGWNKTARKDSVSGRRGVQFRDGRWGVRARIDGRVRRLGSYATLEEAIAVHEAAVKPVHGEFFADE